MRIPGCHIPPAVTVGDIVWLRVVAIDSRGATLDWSGPTELILPRATAVGPVEIGRSVLVKVLPGPDGRPVASMFLHDHLSDVSSGLKDGDRVSLVIADATDLGVKAIANNQFWGLLYANELFRAVSKGQRLDGFVKTVREDGKLDLTLTQPGYAAIDALTVQVLARLKASGGFLALTDKSTPVAISRVFGVSKKQFKQAIGALYKQRLITLEAGGIRLSP